MLGLPYNELSGITLTVLLCLLCIIIAWGLPFELLSSAGEDIIELEMDIILPAGNVTVIVEVAICPGNSCPGPDKVFEVYLGASLGAFVSPIAHANVIIPCTR